MVEQSGKRPKEMITARLRLVQNVAQLKHLEPWARSWALPEMYSWGPGLGAADAAYITALLAENCALKNADMTGGAADSYKCADRVVRAILYNMMGAVFSCRYYLDITFFDVGWSRGSGGRGGSRSGFGL